MHRTPFWERFADASISLTIAVAAFGGAVALTSYLLGSHAWLHAALAAVRVASGWVGVAALISLGLACVAYAVLRGRWGLTPDRQITVVDRRADSARG
jgi:hypothetical protein